MVCNFLVEICKILGLERVLMKEKKINEQPVFHIYKIWLKYLDLYCEMKNKNINTKSNFSSYCNFVFIICILYTEY